MRLAVVTFLLLATPAWGQWTTLSYEPQAPAPKVLADEPPVTMVKKKFPEPVILTAPEGGEVTWVWSRKNLPSAWTYTDKANRKLLLWAPGKYFVAVVVTQQGKAPLEHHYEVEIEGGPGPGPGPDPTPPPPDTLETRMRKAYDADVKAGKVKESEFRLVGEIFKSADQFFAVIPTTGTLYQVLDLGLKTAAPGGMPEARKVIDAHLEKVAPRSKDVPLTGALKDALKVAFSELAKAVEACLAPMPPPGPTPTPGARLVLLIRETANSTPELRQAIIALRVGPHADYLKSRGHTLTVLDDDAVGPDGKPAPILEKWKPHYQNLNLPALILADGTGKVLAASPLSDKATADEVIDAIKKAGG